MDNALWRGALRDYSWVDDKSKLERAKKERVKLVEKMVVKRLRSVSDEERYYGFVQVIEIDVYFEYMGNKWYGLPMLPEQRRFELHCYAWSEVLKRALPLWTEYDLTIEQLRRASAGLAH